MTDLTIAAFDFDRTLTRADSVVPFLRRAAGTGRLAGRLAVRAHRVVPVAIRRDRDALKAIATAHALRGLTRADVERLAAGRAAELIAGGLRPDTVARLLWHRAEGHRTVIVSASYAPYVHLVGAEFGVDAVLATELEFDGSGRCTGRLAGPNCRADEKVRRLVAWMQADGIARERVTLWAYGDSEGDRALLDYADHAVWVGRRLDSVAPSH
ncbi:MAG TPA: HAD-IB family hydrolase [Ilumatobacter sp.]